MGHPLVAIAEVNHDAVIVAAITACALVASSLVQSMRGFRRSNQSQSAIRERQHDLHDLALKNQAAIEHLSALVEAHLESADEESNGRKADHEETMERLRDDG